MKQKQVK